MAEPNSAPVEHWRDSNCDSSVARPLLFGSVRSDFRACAFATRFCRSLVITVDDYAVVLSTELRAVGPSFSSSLLMFCSNVGQ